MSTGRRAEDSASVVSTTVATLSAQAGRGLVTVIAQAAHILVHTGPRRSLQESRGAEAVD